jgi:hypothetical protein
LKTKSIEIIKAQFIGCGPTLVSDELFDLHGIKVSAETARRWMIEEDIWTVNGPGIGTHRRWRERKASVGEMLQMDTSYHNWFGPDFEKSYRIALIDDASSRLFSRFYEADSTLTIMDLLYRYMALNGRPLALYTDRASHFHR